MDSGIGKTTSLGAITLIPPTDIIKATGEELVIDGVTIVFQMVPNTEAPAEMNFYFPQFKALLIAEDATHTLHNLYTLRGAQVRDAHAWWKSLNETIQLFGGRIDVVFASHQWPTWGRERAVKFIATQRDLYKYILDQSLRLLNSGYTMTEIGEMLKPPPALSHDWYLRGYYGSVDHDAKAVYQKYLGWYDSNPADLYPLPPVKTARKYVEFMGGADAVIRKARISYKRGEYRWVAQVMKQVVFADPDNQAARDLQADALEQLGYQSENALWRNEFLVGAFELRHGVQKLPIGVTTANPDILRAMTVSMLLDYLGTQIDPARALGRSIKLNLILPDTNEKYALSLENAVLIYTAGSQLANADATMTIPRARLNDILLHQTTFENEVAAGHVTVAGDGGKLDELLGLTSPPDPMFNIITPIR